MNSDRHRSIGKAVAEIPIMGPIARKVYRKLFPRRDVLFDSSDRYWDRRYAGGGTSGAGSYGRLALFKAEVLNKFVADNGVGSVVEFGCGDGAQLELAHYPSYVGVDVSPRAVEICRSKFADDPSKRFLHTSAVESADVHAELAMSLDVIYHLVEDEAYDAYMSRLARAGRRFLCIYSSNSVKGSPSPHVRHRCFTDWLAIHAPSWGLREKVPNIYPEDPMRPDDTSWADFYFFETRA